MLGTLLGSILTPVLNATLLGVGFIYAGVLTILNGIPF